MVADSKFDLRSAAQSAIRQGGDRVIAYDASWRDGHWLVSAIARFEDHLTGMPAVGLVARNRPQHVALCLANLAAGRTTAMLNCAQSQAGLAREIRSLRLPAVVAERSDWSDQTLAAAREVGTFALATNESAGGDLELLIRPSTPAAEHDGVEVALQLLSSGTTSAPKRIDLSWHSVTSAVENAGKAYAGSDASAPQVMVHPLGNISGLAYAIPPLVFGRPLVLLDRFTPQGWAQAVRDYAPKRGTVPPVGIRMLLDSEVPPDWLASLDLVAVGGGKIAQRDHEAFEERFGIPILTAYGATEFGGVIANWTLDEYRKVGSEKRGSAGRASAGVSLRVVDPESGEARGADVVGLLEAKVARLGEGWIRTTDLASLDRDGFLFIHGRADGAINRGGFKVVPEYVESKLRQLEGIADAVVVGIPDQRLGEVPVAVLESKPGVQLDPETIAAQLRDILPAYQIPVEFKVLDTLPRNASLKVALGEVRRLFS